MKTCSKCRQYEARPGQKWCLACHRAWMRTNRRRHYELEPEQKMKANARSYANVCQRRGIIKPKPCQRCGSLDVQKHHQDYDDALDIIWLCRDCHLAIHETSNSKAVRGQRDF